jgi:hypothetical protein
VATSDVEDGSVWEGVPPPDDGVSGSPAETGSRPFPGVRGMSYWDMGYFLRCGAHMRDGARTPYGVCEGRRGEMGDQLPCRCARLCDAVGARLLLWYLAYPASAA